MENVVHEQVRFEESFLFGSGKLPSKIAGIPGVDNLRFLTDGYGPSGSFHQLHLLFGNHSAGGVVCGADAHGGSAEPRGTGAEAHGASA